MRKLFAALAILVGLGGVAYAAENFPLREMKDASVTLFAEKDGNPANYFCSGVAIGPTTVLTAGHCAKDWVRGKNHIYVGFNGNDVRREAQVLKVDEEADYAVLYVPVPDSVKPAVVACRDAEWGEPVAATGNPFGIRDAISLGHVASVSQEGYHGQDLKNGVALDIAITYGNSGGPVFDESGRVIGLVVQLHLVSPGWGLAWQDGFAFMTPSTNWCK